MKKLMGNINPRDLAYANRMSFKEFMFCNVKVKESIKELLFDLKVKMAYERNLTYMAERISQEISVMESNEIEAII